MTVAGDVMISSDDKLYGGRKKKIPTTEKASSYYWCVALARKDFRLDDINEREAPKNAANFVSYGTAITLIRTPWWERQSPKIPLFGDSRPRVGGEDGTV